MGILLLGHDVLIISYMAELAEKVLTMQARACIIHDRARLVERDNATNERG